MKYLILLIITINIYSWNGKTHVSLGRELLKSINITKELTNSGSYLQNSNIKLNDGQTIFNDYQILKCIKENPSYFLGGNIGPDGFPDIFTGEIATHEENTAEVLDSKGNIDYKLLMKHTCEQFGKDTVKYQECETDIKRIICEQFDETDYINTCYLNIGIELSHHLFEELPKGSVLGKKLLKKIPYKYRTPSFWRMIDWGQYLLENALQPIMYASGNSLKKSNHPVWKAVKNREISNLESKYLEKNSSGNYVISDTTLAEDLRCQAIAFSYGYLNHISSDAFGHDYIDDFVGEYFNMEDFTDLTQETSHLALEEYVAFILKPWLFQHNPGAYVKCDGYYHSKCTTYSVCDPLDPFAKLNPECKKNTYQGTSTDLGQIPAYPLENIPLNNIDIPVVFLAETLMSKDIIKASPLSLHIKLFNEIIKFVDDFETKLAFGVECSTNFDCTNFGLNSFCGENGYCSNSYSLAYKVLNDSCAEPITPSVSAYLFNECITLGRLGDTTKMEQCLGDLKNFMLFSYLKGVRERTQKGVYDWVLKSRDIMKYGIVANEELNDFRVETQTCRAASAQYDQYGYLLHSQCDFGNLNDANMSESMQQYYSDKSQFECQLGYCKPRPIRLNVENHLMSYVDILNYIIMPDENSDIIQLFNHACDNINRYNYVDICEYSKSLLKDEIIALINEVQSLVLERATKYLKPITAKITKVKEVIHRIPGEPEMMFNMAFCTTKEQITACIDSCRGDLTLENWENSVSGPSVFDSSKKLTYKPKTCSDCNFSFDECDNAKKAKQKLFYEAGLLTYRTIGSTNTGTFTLYGENEIKLDTPCETNEGRFSCYMKKLITAGKRASFMKEPQNTDFYKHSPFLNMAPLYNSLQLNKLSVLTKSNMKNVYNTYKNINSYITTENAVCLELDNFLYESKGARFCLNNGLNTNCFERGVETTCEKTDKELYAELFSEVKSRFINNFKEITAGGVNTGNLSVINIVCPRCLASLIKRIK